MKINGVTLSSGGGIHSQIVPPSTYSTNALVNGASLTSVTLFSNILYLYPYIPAKTFNYTSLFIVVTTAVASAQARVLIYSDSGGVPVTKTYESANLDCSTTGQKTISVTGTFNAGTIYWLALHSSSTATITGISSGTMLALRTSSNTPYIAAFKSVTFGSAPSPLAIDGYSQSTQPFIGITI